MIPAADLQARASRRWNLGSGEYPLEFWTNIDADPTAPADRHETFPPLAVEDGGLDEIYLGHALEHLDPDAAAVLLAECYRALRSGGTIGVVVPDLRKILTAYVNRSGARFEYPKGVFHALDDLDAVCRLFLYSTVQASRHQWSYDAETLRRVIEQAAFTVIAAINPWLDARITVGHGWQCGWEAVK